jgi:hypothetical protein
MSEPTVMKMTLLNLSVCVPAEWTDEQVERFANADCPAGTQHGWGIQKAAEYSQDLPEEQRKERVSCGGPNPREGYVHVVLVC